MDHVAIMRKSWGLTDKIMAKEKKIESRWLASRRRPWNSVLAGDTIYFKNSGEPVKIKAKAGKVAQFQSLTARKVESILDEYGKADGIVAKDVPKFFRMFKDKKYCVLVFLKNPRRVKPFMIDKKGFGAMAAWISVDNISTIRKHE